MQNYTYIYINYFQTVNSPHYYPDKFHNMGDSQNNYGQNRGKE